jgi:hypothetical protein
MPEASYVFRKQPEQKTDPTHFPSSGSGQASAQYMAGGLNVNDFEPLRSSNSFDSTVVVDYSD